MLVGLHELLPFTRLSAEHRESNRAVVSTEVRTLPMKVLIPLLAEGLNRDSLRASHVNL